MSKLAAAQKNCVAKQPAAPAAIRSCGAGPLSILCVLVVFALFLPANLYAHDNQRPAALQGVSFDQRLGAQVPGDLEFRDEGGRKVRLANEYGRRPLLLNFAYYQCRELCPLVLGGLVKSLRALSFSAGREFDILTVSIDPRDTPALAAAAKKNFVKQYARDLPEGGWRFLTGDGAAIRRLTETVGFRFNFDNATGRFAHPAGIVLVTPEGKISRYFYGVEFSPRDLRLGMIEASAQRIGSPVDQLLLFCYHYDPATGKYGLLATRLVRAAGAATAAALSLFIFVMLRRENLANRRAAEAAKND
jgi:protein SCO1/2